MPSWASLPIEMRAAVLYHVDGARDFAACMMASRLFHEAASDIDRRAQHYTPDQSSPPNVFDSDEPVGVVAAVWDRWAHRLDLDYDQILSGPARRGRLDVLRFACNVTGTVDGIKPAGLCLCPRWRESDQGFCCCTDASDQSDVRYCAAREGMIMAAEHGHVDATLYMGDILIALGGTRSPAFTRAAETGNVNVIEAILAVQEVGDWVVHRAVTNAIHAGHAEVALWLRDKGWLSDADIAYFSEAMALSASCHGDVPALARAWALLPPPESRRNRTLWTRVLVNALTFDHTGALAWVLDHASYASETERIDGAGGENPVLCMAVAKGATSIATFMRCRGASLNDRQFARALRFAIDEGYGYAAVAVCECFADSAALGDGRLLVECACAVDHVDLVAFVCGRFGRRLVAHARRRARHHQSARIACWLAEHHPL